MSSAKDSVYRPEVDADSINRLEYIKEQLGLATKREALRLCILSTYENILEKKATDIDPLLPVTVRLDEILMKLDLVLPEI